MEGVRKALEALILSKKDRTTITAKVVEVDLDDYTCTVQPIHGGAEYHKVRLQAVADLSGSGVVAIPAVQSDVLVSLIDGNDYSAFIVATGNIDSYTIKTDSSASVDVNNDGTVFLNGDTHGGLIKINELKTQLDKTNAMVNAMATALTTWTPVPADGGAALKTLATSQLAGKTTGVFTNIENETVKHGNA